MIRLSEGPVRFSRIYETAPVGGVPQGAYLNAVAEISTRREPAELLLALKAIERMLGRQDRPRWHEREIDLDILLYGELCTEAAGIAVPHPELARRAFVLQPLLELAPELTHPVTGDSLRELLSKLDASDIRPTAHPFPTKEPANDHA